MYSDDAGHITKMTAMPIYGKKRLEKSSSEPVDRFPRDLVCPIMESCKS